MCKGNVSDLGFSPPPYPLHMLCEEGILYFILVTDIYLPLESTFNILLSSFRQEPQLSTQSTKQLLHTNIIVRSKRGV